MSITDELREFIEDKAWMANNYAKALAIADRIDVEHKKACDDAWDNGYEADYLGIEKWLTDHPQVMEHHGWVRLPLDAGGEYIHAGDVMEERSGHTFEVASLMAFGGSDNWLVLSNARNFSSFREPNDIRHHHVPTVEDVLREFGKAWVEWEDGAAMMNPVETFAAKLRLAEGEDE